MHFCRVILQMIGELHERGYESIRLCPTLSNSGMHWIAWLASAEQVLPHHGAILHPTAMIQAMRSSPTEALAACYTSAHEFRFFGWNDAAEDSPAQLAARFVDRFPTISAEGKRPDPNYVAWYKNMILQTEPEGLPSIYASSPETSLMENNGLVVLGMSGSDSIVLPPPTLDAREQL